MGQPIFEFTQSIKIKWKGEIEQAINTIIKYDSEALEPSFCLNLIKN